MNEPVRILSDLHLGHKISRIESISALRPLISGAATVIFNGDTWQELAQSPLSRSTQMLNELKMLCREESVQPIFLPGNHDPSWPAPHWVELAGGRIIVTHGDALFRSSSPWKREILRQPERVSEIWQQHPHASELLAERFSVAKKIALELRSSHYSSGRSFVQQAWDAVNPPKRAFVMLQTWATQAQAGAEFCDRYFPNAEFLIIGHFHHHGSWLRGNRRIINTGSFTPPQRAHWLEWDNGFLNRGVVDEDHKVYRKGKILDVWRLNPPKE
jgi:UDP-2,3-diacylglucosamine pyrophosphatase LpxH